MRFICRIYGRIVHFAGYEMPVHVPTSMAGEGTHLYAQVRDERHIVTVTTLPFARHNYLR